MPNSNGNQTASEANASSDAQTNASPLRRAFEKLPKRMFVVFLVCLALAILFAVHPLWESTSGIAKEIFITLTVVAGIHILDRMFLYSDTEEALRKMTATIECKSAEQHLRTQTALSKATETKLNEVTAATQGQFSDLASSMTVTLNDVAGQTEHALSGLTKGMSGMIEHVHTETIDTLEQTKSYLRQVSDSLSAMTKVGIGRLYSSREEASKDMLQDLTLEGPMHVRLIGISLNDFVQGKGEFGQAWNRLKLRAKQHNGSHNSTGSSTSGTAHGANHSPILFQIMVIHPHCLGAQLRSKGEARGTDAIESRLLTDVLSVTKEIGKLQALTQRDVDIQCKLYQLAPTLFLCSIVRGTEDNPKSIVTYMQPYFFWNKRGDLAVPMFRFASDSSKPLDDQIAYQLNQHFDLIWQKSAVSIEDFTRQNIVGVDAGLRQAGGINVFLEKAESRKRIVQMLRGAKSKVWIQGISLLSYFSAGDLYQELLKLIEDGKVAIRILLIDPECEQAKLRAFRERLFVSKRETLESFIGSTQFKESTLYKDTTSSISSICSFMEHLVEEKGANDSLWKHNLLVRKYRSAPACFMLRVDDRVLVEQYHYGKATQTDRPEMNVAILGKEMPVMEFYAETDDLFEDSPEVQERKPFRLLEDHFQFAFDNAAEVLPENVLSRCEEFVRSHGTGQHGLGKPM